MSIPSHPTPTRPQTGRNEQLARPQRYLSPHLARAITEAKKRTGLSWRQLAAIVPTSHSHMVNIANGKRVPSIETAEYMIALLDLDDAIADELRAVAAPMWWERLS